MTHSRLAPPTLTPTQLATLESHRIVELSRLLRTMLPAHVVDDARREARIMLRKSTALFPPSEMRLSAACTCGETVIRMIVDNLHTALLDARPLALLAETNRIVLRYLRLFGGPVMRALYHSAERKADARDAAAWN